MSLIDVRGLLTQAAGELKTYAQHCDAYASDIRHEAELLLMHALGHDRAWLYAHATDPVDAAIQATLEGLLARRLAGEPIAYITGRREFWSLDLTVTPDVLIPRVETELLVELALQKIPHDTRIEIADLGTGSGAIALAIASERPQAQVLATDASAAALALAQSNAMRLGIDNVAFAHGDWCAALGERHFDVIVSNPPYIAAGDAHLQQGDLRFEPGAALASGHDGLDAIREICVTARAHLKLRGWLLLEHGFEQGSAVRNLLGECGYAEITTALDWEGRERVSAACFVR